MNNMLQRELLELFLKSNIHRLPYETLVRIAVETKEIVDKAIDKEIQED